MNCKPLRQRKSDRATIALLNDIARYGANMMWHWKPETVAGKLYVRIEEEIQRLESPSATPEKPQ